jgi:tetratricopeptide (TPR) repeat protein
MKNLLDAVGEHLKAGRLAEAESLAREATARSPLDPGTHVATCRVLAATGRLSQALAHLQGVLEAHPDLALVRAWWAVLLDQDGQTQRAEEEAGRAHQAGARVSEAMCLQARALARAGDHRQAYQVLKDSLHAQPSHGGSWRALASVYTAIRRPEQALQALQNAVAARPDDVAAWEEVLRIHAAGSGGLEAQEAVTAALGRHPRHPGLLALAHTIRTRSTTTEVPLGQVVETIREHLVMGRRPEAVKLLQQTVASHKMTRALKFVRLETLLSAPDTDVPGSVVDVTHVKAEYPEAWEPRMILADLLSRRTPVRKLTHAMDEAQEAWHMSGGHPAAGLVFVRALVMSKRAGLARPLAQQVTALRPGWSAVVDATLVARP